MSLKLSTCKATVELNGFVNKSKQGCSRSGSTSAGNSRTSPPTKLVQEAFCSSNGLKVTGNTCQVQFVAGTWCLELYHIVSAWFNLLLQNLSAEK
ncbi:hypothetical protein BDA96_03G129900 [Sorghum bicolor]|uniref:Uncharacterized protein n=2 Tax=Sorghum bicolor TaxID=4558 RepID=A0A921UM27_SORBI|nr:hypothetical protein BDA96_03G129900 [Sorghum bicolor]KXG32231.1 hypothetical protein SORBI_3003G124400 [Sorghum bicolor]